MKKLFTALCMAAIALGAAADTVYLVLPAAPEAGDYKFYTANDKWLPMSPVEGQSTVLKAEVNSFGQSVMIMTPSLQTNGMTGYYGSFGNNWCYANPTTSNARTGIYGVMKQVTVTCENTANWEKVVAYATIDGYVVDCATCEDQTGLLLGVDGVEMSGESLTFLAPSSNGNEGNRWENSTVSKIKFGDGNGNWTEEYDVTDGLQVTNGGSETGISEIAGGQGAAQYYNLQGQPVSQPQGGVYIRVNGNKATKVAL